LFIHVRHTAIAGKETTVNATELAALLQRSEIHREILGDYRGPYALGVGQDPANPGAYVFVLKVPDEHGWPRSVTVDGQQVPVYVQGGFKQPVPSG
jgi:hypothetical protein